MSCVALYVCPSLLKSAILNRLVFFFVCLKAFPHSEQHMDG